MEEYALLDSFDDLTTMNKTVGEVLHMVGTLYLQLSAVNSTINLLKRASLYAILTPLFFLSLCLSNLLCGCVKSRWIIKFS